MSIYRSMTVIAHTVDVNNYVGWRDRKIITCILHEVAKILELRPQKYMPTIESREVWSLTSSLQVVIVKRTYLRNLMKMKQRRAS